MPIDQHSINFFEAKLFLPKDKPCQINSDQVMRTPQKIHTDKRRENAIRESIPVIKNDQNLITQFEELCYDQTAIDVFTYAVSQDGGDTRDSTPNESKPLSVVFDFPSVFKSGMLQQGVFLTQPDDDDKTPQFEYTIEFDLEDTAYYVEQKAKFSLFDASRKLTYTSEERPERLTWAQYACGFFCCCPKQAKAESRSQNQNIKSGQTNSNMEISFLYRLKNENDKWIFESVGVNVPGTNIIKETLLKMTPQIIPAAPSEDQTEGLVRQMTNVGMV